MLRVQVQLTEEQLRALRAQAARERIARDDIRRHLALYAVLGRYDERHEEALQNGPGYCRRTRRF